MGTGMNRNMLKIFCLLVSILIWIQVASNRYVERELSLPLELHGLQPGMTLAGNEWPSEVDLHARISKWRFLLYRYFGNRLGSVDIDISNAQPGVTWQREISVNDVDSPLSDIEVTPPQSLILEVDRVDSLRVPVRIVTTGELSGSRMLLEPLSASPGSLIVRGPSRYFTGREVLRTEPLDMGRVVHSQVVSRRLVMPHPHLKTRETEVDVVINVSARKERIFEHIPVVPLIDADQPGVELFPPVATLVVSGPEDSLAALPSSRISVTMSLTGLEPGAHTLKPEIHVPPLYGVISIEPESFMAVIGGQRDRRESGAR